MARYSRRDDFAPTDEGGVVVGMQCVVGSFSTGVRFFLVAGGLRLVFSTAVRWGERTFSGGGRRGRPV